MKDINNDNKQHDSNESSDANEVRIASKLGSSVTEAWANVDHVEKGSLVSIPSEEAVELAKEWVEENEK